MARPAPYSGSAEDCSGFLLQCELVLEMQPHLYPNDTAKIAFIISQLQGKALRWADSLWAQKGPAIQSYSSFVSHFREAFGKSISDSSIVVALLDSGSAGNFISGALCRQFQLKTSPSPSIYQIHSITGKPLSRKKVSRCVGPLQLRVGILHVEDIHLLVLEESTSDVVLGPPWLEQHSPTISWRTGEVLKWGDHCFPTCFSELPVPKSPRSNVISICTTSIESPVEKRSVDIPACYAPFSDVFYP
ncbi:Retrotransposon-like protein 1 [Anabarilius grahami]|uniref:Retrotransposon-like protein 1 n=1 Tax=Anabarilius grahami TaxID=495550 RepID=A0A3N0YG38_ANAGA|nr:Retrotransposon-like protein 1 [Anabarilius grahami]